MAYPNYSCLSTACLSVTIVTEYFYRLKDKNSDRAIQVSFSSTTNDSFVDDSFVDYGDTIWARVFWYFIAILITAMVGFFQVLDA